jgi:hypothetical protein
VGRLSRLVHVLQHKRGERALDRDEARAEGVSAREIRHRRKRWSRELHARRARVYRNHEHPKGPDALVELLQSPPIAALFEQIRGLTLDQLDALAKAGADDTVVRFFLTKARLRFPGGEVAHAAFRRLVFDAVSEREHAVGATCSTSDVAKVVEAAGLALAAGSRLERGDVDAMMRPWRTVTTSDVA